MIDMNRAELIAHFEGHGFEAMVTPKPNALDCVDQLCLFARINGVPITFIGDLPTNPIIDHADYAFNIWHHTMLILAHNYGYGTA